MADQLDGLLARVDEPALRADLRAHIERIRAKRSFGLVFESHLPERVRLPEHPVRIGIKVAVRDDTDSAAYEVLRVDGTKATIRKVRHPNGSPLSAEDVDESVDEHVAVEALVVIADFGEPVYPGLRRLGVVDRGGDKPAHVVIKGENHHVLEALQFAHTGKVDCIYIDPPYNTGARDWKYDNNYVDDSDVYRHSKWLAFMERRLDLARDLLNPDDSVLIVTIDEKEYLRLGLLLEQVFAGARQQMISVTTNPKGTARPNEFSRVDEFAYFVLLGSAVVPAMSAGDGPREVRWKYLRRNDLESVRGSRPRQFYPIYVDETSGKVSHVGAPLDPRDPMESSPTIEGSVPVFPIREDGLEMEWGLTGPSFGRALEHGFVRVTSGYEK
jgi:adenine-specific DNA-methyltransferase